MRINSTIRLEYALKRVPPRSRAIMSAEDFRLYMITDVTVGEKLLLDGFPRMAGDCPLMSVIKRKPNDIVSVTGLVWSFYRNASDFLVGFTIRDPYGNIIAGKYITTTPSGDDLLVILPWSGAYSTPSMPIVRAIEDVGFPDRVYPTSIKDLVRSVRCI